MNRPFIRAYDPNRNAVLQPEPLHPLQRAIYVGLRIELAVLVPLLVLVTALWAGWL